MHATTLGQLNTQLGGYVAPGQSFAPSLNQALETIYGMGAWRDLTIEGTFDCSNGYFSLPDLGESVLYAAIDNQPVRVRSLWHDYRVNGFSEDNLINFGIVDDGFRPVQIDLPSSGVDVLFAVPSAEAIGNTSLNEDNGEQIKIIGYGANNYILAEQLGATFDFPEIVTGIHELQYSGLVNRYDIRLTANDPATTIATVGPGDAVARFRRYRVPQAKTGSFAHVLCKRRFIPVQNDSDPVYINNIPALKHALLGVLAEDNADLERAEIHWTKCRQILDEQLDQYRGPARPSLDLQLAGDGIIGVRNFF
jgi:hypothetical protein